MTAATWLSIAAILASVVTGYLTYRASTRAAASSASAAVRVKTIEVDAAAYERARLLYESGITQLEEQISRLRSQVNEERDSSNRLRDQVGALEETVARLRRQLILAGIDVAHATSPTGPVEPG